MATESPTSRKHLATFILSSVLVGPKSTLQDFWERHQPFCFRFVDLDFVTV